MLFRPLYPEIGNNMSHNFRKPKPISEARRAAARASGAALVLTTESKERYEALLESYRDEYKPKGQTENDLVEELTAAKWLHRRTMDMITALLDVTMDRMAKEISNEFQQIDNAARTALAFAKQTDESGALTLLHRYAARHARDYHRALDKLRQIQSERRPEQELQNEPKPDVTPEPSTTSDPLATRHSPLASETSHQPPPTDRQSELATRHSSLATETGHRPLTRVV
jgi:hypothetical protein